MNSNPNDAPTAAPTKTAAGAAPLLDEAAIERAEVALKEMAKTLESWIDDEVALLTQARAALRSNGVSVETIDALSHKAHDLKGQGTTLNFPFVTKIADLLCKLCEHLPDPNDLPMPLVDAHVDAMRAIVRDGIKGDAHPTGSAIVAELQTRVGQTLAGWRRRAVSGR